MTISEQQIDGFMEHTGHHKQTDKNVLFSKDGLTVQRLHELMREIVRANIDLVFLEIAANDISSETSVVELGDSLLAFAIFLQQ